jgi:ornithine carbamoyltransferase
VPRHLLTGEELTPDEVRGIVARALELKAAPLSSNALNGKAIALMFEKPSTRTRVSFEVGVSELGGTPIVLGADELQISRGESLADTGRVLAGHVAAVGLRTGADERLAELASESSVPVFNMLTAGHHPCQALADHLVFPPVTTHDRPSGCDTSLKVLIVSAVKAHSHRTKDIRRRFFQATGYG